MFCDFIKTGVTHLVCHMIKVSATVVSVPDRNSWLHFLTWPSCPSQIKSQISICPLTSYFLFGIQSKACLSFWTLLCSWIQPVTSLCHLIMFLTISCPWLWVTSHGLTTSWQQFSRKWCLQALSSGLQHPHPTSLYDHPVHHRHSFLITVST